MDACKTKLVQDSFEKIAVNGTKVAEVFYRELFGVDPSLRSMFGANMDAQNEKLFAALTLIVRSLDAHEGMADVIERLAVKHLEYGVRPEHYTYVGNALLRALKASLGPDFTPELCEAWTDAFRMLARLMKEAAYGRPAIEIGNVQ